MPKDPKKNIQRYKVQGGHLNEFEYQQSQSKLAEHSDLPFADQAGQPGLSQADRVAGITADAHQIVERRKKTGTATAGSVKKAAPRKRAAKKRTGKSAKKTVKGAVTKKQRTGVSGKKSSKKVARSSKKTAEKKSTRNRK